MNLARSLHYSAERTPDAEAVVEGDTRLSYAQLRHRAACLAGALARLGVGRQEVVATVLKNRRENVELFWACQWLGAVYMPLSWRNPPEAVQYCVEDAQAKVVVYEPVSEELVDALDGPIAVGTAGASADRSYPELLETDPAEGAFDLDPSATSLMLYTSGTTGRPKGVPRSHHAEGVASLAQALQHGYRPGERTLGVMPLYHTMGIHSMVSVSLMGGCYLCQTEWSGAEALDLTARERITSLYLAPTLFFDLVEQGRARSHDVSSVRALGYAGAAMTGALVERCEQMFGPEVFVNHYGSTEIYCYTIGHNQRDKPGNAGRPSVNAWIRLVAPEERVGPDDLVKPGEEGQIICHMSSDEAFGGYWNRPDADAKSIREGWYFTGDLGRVDDDGDLWILGRIDDMIISGGENVHPLEVEEVLARAPGVRELAVHAAPDDRWGQRVVASVVADPGVTAEDLDAFCLASPDLARFKRPREYRFVDSLPKTPSGKVLRRVLREGEDQ